MNRRLGLLTLLTVMFTASFITLAATPAEATAPYHLRKRVKQFFERAKHPTLLHSARHGRSNTA